MAWTDIEGHAFVKRIWQAHIAAGQIANAYLLVGPDGIGKRRLALELAKALNCQVGGGSACGACTTCQQIGRSVHPDCHLLVGSGASDQIKMDDVRTLLGRLMLKPFSAKVQVAIIDGAERLTEEAANSLLKTLEEPPRTTRFVLTTSRLPQCLPTIVSRCQLLRLHRLAPEELARILAAQQVGDPSTPLGMSPEELHHPLVQAAARSSEGSVARAMELLASWQRREQLLHRLADGTTAAWFDPPLPEGRAEVTILLDEMIGWLRDLAMSAVAEDALLLHADSGDALHRQAKTVDVDRCLETAQTLMTLRESLEDYANPRLVAALAREHYLDLVGTAPHA